MADIAIIFHWPPQAMDGMAVSELMHWRAQACLLYTSDAADE